MEQETELWMRNIYVYMCIIHMIFLEQQIQSFPRFNGFVANFWKVSKPANQKRDVFNIFRLVKQLDRLVKITNQPLPSPWSLLSRSGSSTKGVWIEMGNSMIPCKKDLNQKSQGYEGFRPLHHGSLGGLFVGPGRKPLDWKRR